MKQTITRTITVTTINYAVINVENGQPTFKTQKPVKHLGTITDNEQAIKALKNHTDEQVTILSLDTKQATYEMDLNEFMSLANKIEKGNK